MQQDKRQYLKQLTEEDRKAKLLDKIQDKPTQQAVFSAGQDNISKLFDRPTHVAYERRQKQDEVINHINEKFLVERSNPKDKLRTSYEQQSGFNSQFAPEVAFKLAEKRKEKTN